LKLTKAPKGALLFAITAARKQKKKTAFTMEIMCFVQVGVVANMLAFQWIAENNDSVLMYGGDGTVDVSSNSRALRRFRWKPSEYSEIAGGRLKLQV